MLSLLALLVQKVLILLALLVQKLKSDTDGAPVEGRYSASKVSIGRYADTEGAPVEGRYGVSADTHFTCLLDTDGAPVEGRYSLYLLY